MLKKPVKRRRARHSRKKKVARLKRAIEAGEYSVDNRKLAHSLFFVRPNA